MASGYRDYTEQQIKDSLDAIENEQPEKITVPLRILRVTHPLRFFKCKTKYLEGISDSQLYRKAYSLATKKLIRRHRREHREIIMEYLEENE